MRLLLALALVLSTGCAEAERLATGAIDDVRTSRPRADDSSQRPATYETSQGQRLSFPLGARAFADRAVSYDNNGSGIHDDNDNPSEALGPPTGADTYLSLGGGGTVVLEFTDNVLVDGPGADLAVFEIGPQAEAATVAVSEDGRSFVTLGRIAGSTATLDLAGRGRAGAAYRFVRITDDIEQGDRRGRSAGADIDAVGTLNGRAR